MITAPLLPDEPGRIAALRALAVLDTPQEERFDRITRLAATALDVPIALVSLVDSDRQWFKSCIGLDVSETDRGSSFCGHAIARDDVFVVPDATVDPRFHDNPLVLGEPYVQSYAGAPIRAGGHRVGTLCVLDHRPRQLDDRQLSMLRQLADRVERELEHHELGLARRRQHEAERRFQLLVESMRDLFVAFDTSGHVIEANPAAAHALGTGEDGLLGRAVTSFVSAPPAGEVAALLDRAAAGERIERREVVLRADDGRELVLDVAFGAVELDGRRIFTASGRDLTEERRAAREIDRLRRQQELILESSFDGIVLLGVDGLVRYANPAAHALLGAEPGALHGSDLHAVAHHSRPDGSAFAAERCDTYAALHDGTATSSHRDVYWRADGTPIDVTLTVAPVRDEHGVVTGAVAVLSDATAAVELERAKDEFVSMVSHELRTPLTSLRGSLGLVAAGVLGELPERATPMVRMAVTSTDRLMRLVNDILDLQRLDAHRITLDVRPHRLADIVTTTVDGVRGVAEAHGVAVVDEVVDVELDADADRVVQVLTNLVANAIKFSPEGSTVWLRSRHHDGDVVVDVVDRGRGIPADQLDRVFERFRQVESGDARHGHGSGLGLPIARGLAEQHGGRLEVTSVTGEGSTFTLVLPRRAAVAPPEAAGTPGTFADAVA